jgi:ribosome maturation factor RimP
VRHPWKYLEVGLARFFLARMELETLKTSPEEIENRIAEIDPEVEFLTVESGGGDVLRIYIDHPGGVSLGICQKVTSGLGELLEEHTLEVSSPGPQRPLTRPEHYSRFEGRRAKVRTAEPIEGRRNFTGTILEAGEREFTLGCDGELARISYESVERSHLVPVIPEGASK